MDGFSAASQMLRSLFEGLRDPMVRGIGEFFLALVFTISGTVKIRQPQPTAESIHRFGVGHRPYTILGLLLGLAEVALAVLLASSGWLAPWLAAMVLWVFAILIARSLLAGQHFACHCFGGSDSDMSWFTFSRTAALAVLATLLVDAGNTSSATLSNEDRLAQAVIAAAVFAILMLLARASRLVELSRVSVRTLENPTA